MDDFKTRKIEYFERLKSNKKVLNGINNGKNSLETMAVILDPKDDFELIVANNIITLFSDLVNIVEINNSYYFKPKSNINLDEVPIVDLFKRMIIALKYNNKEELSNIKNEITNNYSVDYMARMTYDMMNVMGCNIDEVLNYLQKECDFDIKDDLSESQFYLYFNQANEVINNYLKEQDDSIKIPITNFTKIDDLREPEVLENFERFISIFHELYQRDYENTNNKKR